MSKRLLWALLLIAFLIIVLLLNGNGHVKVTVLPKVSIATVRSVAFFIFAGVGVAIGLLLK